MSRSGCHRPATVFHVDRHILVQNAFVQADTTGTPALRSLYTPAICRTGNHTRIERECLSQVLNNPARAWGFADAEMKDSPAIMPNYEEDPEEAEGSGRNFKEVDARQRIAMVTQEGLPLADASVGGRPLGETAGQR